MYSTKNAFKNNIFTTNTLSKNTVKHAPTLFWVYLKIETFRATKNLIPNLWGENIS